MPYTEGILWYVILIDVTIYNVMCYTKKWQHKTHWLSKYFPYNKFFGAFYTILVLWLGFALYRMQLLGF